MKEICEYCKIKNITLYRAICCECKDEIRLCSYCYYYRDKSHEQNVYMYNSILNIVCTKCIRNKKIKIII